MQQTMTQQVLSFEEVERDVAQVFNGVEIFLYEHEPLYRRTEQQHESTLHGEAAPHVARYPDLMQELLDHYGLPRESDETFNFCDLSRYFSYNVKHAAPTSGGKYAEKHLRWSEEKRRTVMGFINHGLTFIDGVLSEEHYRKVTLLSSALMLWLAKHDILLDVVNTYYDSVYHHSGRKHEGFLSYGLELSLQTEIVLVSQAAMQEIRDMDNEPWVWCAPMFAEAFLHHTDVDRLAALKDMFFGHLIDHYGDTNHSEVKKELKKQQAA